MVKQIININSELGSFPEIYNPHFLPVSSDTCIGMIICENCGTALYGSWKMYVGEGQALHNIYQQQKEDVDKYIKTYGPGSNWEERKNQWNELIENCKRADRESSYIFDHLWDPNEGSFPCPVCGNVVRFIRTNTNVNYAKTSSWQDYRVIDKNSQLDMTYNKCYKKLINEDKRVSQKKLDEKLNSFETELPDSLFTEETIGRIKSSSEELKRFLKNLIKIEMDIFAISQRLLKLYNCLPEFRRNFIQQKYSYILQSDININILKNKITQKKLELESSSTISPEKIGLREPKKPEKPISPIYKKSNFFNRKKTEAENRQKEVEYQAAIDQYESAIVTYGKEYEIFQNKYKEKIKELHDNYQADIRVTETELEVLINNTEEKIKEKIENSKEYFLFNNVSLEIQKAEELLRKLVCTKKSYYDTDIVFGKYQSVVAISTFYEYLCSGRCDSLEGVNGVYNIYEAETRANIIVDKLSVIIDSLEKIQRNQYTIYSEICAVNSILDNLDQKMNGVLSSMEDIKANTEVISYNTAVTAFYSEKNAELTNALGYLVASK